MAEKVGICWQIFLVPECVGLVARPVFETGLRPLRGPWRFDSPAFRPSVSREGDDRRSGGFLRQSGRALPYSGTGTRRFAGRPARGARRDPARSGLSGRRLADAPNERVLTPRLYGSPGPAPTRARDRGP